VAESSGTNEKIPFVFLPLAPGAAIFPTADIRILGANATSDGDALCVVASTQLVPI
jgi:hypothetical protein